MSSYGSVQNISDRDDSTNKLSNPRARVTSASPNHGHYSQHQLTPPLASDVFDIGYTLLTCALGNLEFFDSTGFYTLEGLKSLIDSFVLHRRHQKNYCCLLHSEEELRKFNVGLTVTSMGKDSSRKPPLTNNFQLRTPRTNETLTSRRYTAPFTLLELLQSSERHSDSFIEFLCCCLRLDSTARLEPESLLEHEFLSQSHISLGPQMLLPEFVNSSRKELDQSPSQRLNEAHLDRVCDAIKIVLMNKEAKNSIASMGKSYATPYTREHRKMKELAAEMAVPVVTVIAKFKEEVFAEDSSH